jgi:hypothetical protein
VLLQASPKIDYICTMGKQLTKKQKEQLKARTAAKLNKIVNKNETTSVQK